MILRRRKASNPEVKDPDSEETKEKAATKAQEKKRKRKDAEETLLTRVIAHVKKIVSGQPVEPRKSPPFSVTPCKFDTDTFGHCNPFVEVARRHSVQTGALDKVRHAKHHPMDAAAFRLMGKQFAREVERAKRLCPRGFSELGFRDIHLSYLKPLFYMVDPYVPREVEACTDRDLFKKRRMLAGNSRAVESETRGVYFQVEPGLTERSRLLGLEMLYEGDSGAKQRQADANRFDIEMNGHDLNVPPELDDLVTLAYGECKRHEDDLPDAICQAAEYSKSGAFRNMSKGRFAPIHLFGMSKAQWTYGMLLPYGKVYIRDGAVAEIDSIHEEDRKGYIEDRFKRATKMLQEKYPGQCYPDGLYLTGYLYMEPERHLLPFQGSSHEDSRAFWQPLLEVVAGRHACEWPVEEVQRRVEAANTELDNASDLYFD